VWIAGLKALISSWQGGRSKIDGWSDGGLYLDVCLPPLKLLVCYDYSNAIFYNMEMITLDIKLLVKERNDLILLWHYKF